MALDPTYPSLPIFNFLGFVVALIPLPWLFSSTNIGASAFSIWASLQCLDTFVRTIVWRDNYRDSAPVYCDISSRLQVIANVALPCISLCINRRLFLITRFRKSEPSTSKRYREIGFDIFLCYGLPLLQILLYYMTQARRYAIDEQYGCSPVTQGDIVAILIIYGIPLVPILISVVYSPFIITRLIKSRKEIDDYCRTDSDFSRQQFIRLLALSSFDALITLPTFIFLFTLNIVLTYQGGGDLVVFAQKWNIVHAEMNEILLDPASDWRQSKLDIGLVYYGNWLNVAWAFLFFLFFGTTSDMRARYSKAFWFIVKPFGLRRTQQENLDVSEVKFKSAPAQKSTLSSGAPSIALTSSVDESSADSEKRADFIFEKEVELEAQHTEFSQ